ncbi:hypothetical protein J2Y48_003120 [Mycoplana sp. BE70]|uniref:DUF7146 domain-containing protein n=1 Tax=Mycoplana sp. BE70 TaxID=2817775 RepID=UPI00285AFD00|nr:primase-helicase zinc-binding domain-containing protein [Mycoplana sp. BE70]MDR6757823.1 hypothetical protein [Mycoplana sp. BE70]
MTAALDVFIDEARSVSVTDAAAILGYTLTRSEFSGPCPVCGGRDRFSISTAKQAWNCRQCGRGGRDGIGLIAHARGHDVSTRTGFLTACSEALQREIPAEGERETDEQRAARLAVIEDRRRHNAEVAARASNDFRDKAIAKGRGIYFNARKVAPGERCAAADYLQLRTGFEMPDAVWANIRFDPTHSYWSSRKDDRGHHPCLHVGPAMIAPFVDMDGKVTGCHETWIDLARGPKFRPLLADGDDVLPTKKMQGVKRGSMIPLFGLMSSTRWVGGEGIENGLAIAGAEGFPRDTFYFAAGDLGNLAGPADPASAFNHPTLTMTDKRGRSRAVRVQGPEPKQDLQPGEVLVFPDRVAQLVLLADGDSEPVFTAAAMARAERLHSRGGREIETWWPPTGSDFSKLMAG